MEAEKLREKVKEGLEWEKRAVELERGRQQLVSEVGSGLQDGESGATGVG